MTSANSVTLKADAMAMGAYKALEAAGIVTYRNPHMTRHTFATRYLRAGGRLETLSMVMGHSSIKITADLYCHLDTSDVALDMALLGV